MRRCGEQVALRQAVTCRSHRLLRRTRGSGREYVGSVSLLQYHTIYSCVAQVQFGHRLKTRREIEARLGDPAGPAPGGNVPVPSFVEDDKRQNKGVKFGHKLPTRREIEAKLGYPAGPAPGGNVPVPSFVEDDKRQNKGYMGASGC